MSRVHVLEGQVFNGTYRLGPCIGAGGMGTVHSAQHLGTGRTVAIKVLLPELVDNAAHLERFRREARATGRLRHPNVVDVTDFGVARVGARDVAYLVMEILEGQTLRAVLDARGALPLEVAVEIVEQIAAALDAAHAAGVVHRDLKPENVWLVPDARGGYGVRVLDFGIALMGLVEPAAAIALPVLDPPPQFASGTGADPAATQVLAAAADTASGAVDGDTTGRLTHIGAVVGTPFYMSPEQWRSEALTAASDTYSLGVLAFEMLAGRRPFTGPHAVLAVAHQQREPPALAMHPPVVARAVARALAKVPADRYASSGIFAGSLRVAAEPAGVVLRRAAALYASRWPEMHAVAAWCARVPVAIATLAAIGLALAMAFVDEPLHRSVWLTCMILGPLMWMVVMVMSNAMFALAVDQLRSQPFADLAPAALAAELKARLGLRADAGWLRTVVVTAVYYLSTESKAKAGNGDLAFLVRFFEGRTLAEVPARTAVLSVGVRRAYVLVAAAVIVSLLLPVVEAAVLVLATMPFGAPEPRLAFAAAALLLPINAMLVNPATSSAFALLYFRARQANGELGAGGALLRGRL